MSDDKFNSPQPQPDPDPIGAPDPPPDSASPRSELHPYLFLPPDTIVALEAKVPDFIYEAAENTGPKQGSQSP